MLALRVSLIAHPGPTTDRAQISVMVFSLLIRGTL
jgi:hypothetical protein